MPPNPLSAFFFPPQIQLCADHCAPFTCPYLLTYLNSEHACKQTPWSMDQSQLTFRTGSRYEKLKNRTFCLLPATGTGKSR